MTDSAGREGQVKLGPIQIIPGPTNLELRPNASGEPVGTWRGADVLLSLGLANRIGAQVVTGPSQRDYCFEAESDTRVRNGQRIRKYSMELADAVERSLSDGGFPLVLGGDCSNLLGAVLGLRRTGGRGLIHLDGHSDFFHPGNYDACSRLGSVAGMDLALVTGRGEPLLTEWHGVARPLVEDADVIQIGEREGEDADYPFGEISLTDIWQMTVQAALGVGIHQAVERTKQRLVERELSAAWLHVDLDVLDQTVMPAVDSPGSPGLTYGTLAEMVRGLLATGRMVGMDVTIYDPDLDPDREYGREIVECLVEAVRV